MLSVPSNHRLPREQYRWLVFIFILAPLDSTVGLIASPASASNSTIDVVLVAQRTHALKPAVA